MRASWCISFISRDHLDDVFDLHRRLCTPAAIAREQQQRFIDARKVVLHEKQCDRSGVILDLFRERIRESVKRRMPILVVSFARSM
jgi:hypothetical protein